MMKLSHKKITDLIFLLFPAAFNAAADVFFHGGCFGWAVLILKVLGYFLLFLLFFAGMEKLFSHFCLQTSEKRWHRVFRYSGKNILCLSLLLFVVYAFYLLVYYPGTCGYDTVNQITDLVTGEDPLPFNWGPGQAEVSALMNDHHPVVTTVIFTLFYKLGLYFGNANRGMFLYNLLQISVLSVLFATVVCSMDRFEVPKPVALISAVFYASPVIAYFAISMIKDALFSLFFVLYYLAFIGLAVGKEQEEGTRGRWGLLILLSVMIALMNKKGMYLALVSGVCLFFIQRGGKRLLSLVSAFLPAVLVVVLMGRILFPLLNIYPGGKQETLGFAFQQTALAMMERPETFSEREKEVFFSVLDLSPDTLPGEYDPASTDSIKEHYRFDTPDDMLRAYVRQWLLHFFKTPGCYVRASLSVCGGFIAPVKAHNVYMNATWHGLLQAFCQTARFEGVRNAMGTMFLWFGKTPIIRILFQDSLYMFWFPAFSLYRFCRQRQWKKLVAMAPLAANFVFLLLGPVCWTRYGLCQLYVFPVLLALTCGTRKTEG